MTAQPAAKAPAAKRAATATAAKTSAKRAPAPEQAATKEAGTKEAGPTQAATTKTATTKTATKAATKAATEKAPAKKAATNKAPAKRAAKAAPAAPPGGGSRHTGTGQRYAVKEGEQPWTAAEIAEIRATIEGDIATLRGEITEAEHEVAALMRQSGDGAGDDQADAGSKTLEREQEMSLANNAREMLLQDQHAIERIDDGTYGICENCGQPIGKLRLEANPRATLCVPCKSKQERR
ncbi:MAG: TraR/DksA C4-type zinc finger protein [Austwickia sp.]|nr:TraR/DksA C4-type zinc finger protein [Austwickia sp.]